MPRPVPDGATGVPVDRLWTAYRRTVRMQQVRRPSPARWLWYAFGGGLPREYAPWVLADTTGHWWAARHLARALVQLLPVLVGVLLVPVPLPFRLAAAGGGVFMGLLFSAAYMVETTEHRVVKAGYPSGTSGRVRAERVERERRRREEERSPYRRGGAGSFD
jgi:hypothetical protein